MAEITKYVSRNGDNPTYSTDLERLSDATINALAGLGFLNEGKIIGGDWENTPEKRLNVGYLYFKGKLWGFPDTMAQYSGGYLYAVAEWDDTSTKVVTVGSAKTEYKQRIKYTQAVEATQIADVDNGDGTGKWFVGYISSSTIDIRNMRIGAIRADVAFSINSLSASVLKDKTVTNSQLQIPNSICSVGEDSVSFESGQNTMQLSAVIDASDGDNGRFWTKRVDLTSTSARVVFSTISQYVDAGLPLSIPIMLTNTSADIKKLVVKTLLGSTPLDVPANTNVSLLFHKQVSTADVVSYILVSTIEMV